MELLVLLLALVFIVLVGHGIWVGLAALFRALTQSEGTPAARGSRRGLPAL